MSYLETAKRTLGDLRSRPARSATEAQEDLVAAMGLEEFARAGLIVRVHSRILGRDVLFVSDGITNAEIQEQELPVYRAADMRKLAILKPNPRHLRWLHEIRDVFQGTEIADEEGATA